MKAGRELDALVAEKVMGLRVFNDKREYALPFILRDGVNHPPPFMPDEQMEIPHFSTEIAAAWMVVEKVLLHISPMVCREGLYAWVVSDKHDLNATNLIVIEESAPLAICFAGLKAVGVESEYDR